jgi:hypothetical protein
MPWQRLSTESVDKFVSRAEKRALSDQSATIFFKPVKNEAIVSFSLKSNTWKRKLLSRADFHGDAGPWLFTRAGCGLSYNPRHVHAPCLS